MEERMQKILAHAGFGSRRACEELIRQGRVAVDGKPVQVKDAHANVALHKPQGVLSETPDRGCSGHESSQIAEHLQHAWTQFAGPRATARLTPEADLAIMHTTVFTPSGLLRN
jgi:16S rRNA U516 pseudouridylate synthase RsuA-like enzyme